MDLNEKVPTTITPENFNLLLAHAYNGNVTLADLLDGMFVLDKKLSPHVSDQLLKYLSKDAVLTVRDGDLYSSPVLERPRQSLPLIDEIR